MSYFNKQSIAQIKELSQKEFIQKHHGYIDKFSGRNCKLSIDFCKEACGSSEKRIYKAKVYLTPLNISKSEAFKQKKIKCFSGKIFQIKEKENRYYVKKYKDVFLLLYFRIMFFRLCLIGQDKFFKEGLLDLFIKVFFQNRLGRYSDDFRGHNISFIPLIVFAVLVIIATLIASYFDIRISKNLGW